MFLRNCNYNFCLFFRQLQLLRYLLLLSVLELDEGSLKLLEPESGAVLNSQQIHAIRHTDPLHPLSSPFYAVM